MGDTGIQWTDKTWNPITGCSKVSQGCKNCYAERIWKKVYGTRPFTDIQIHDNRIGDPLHWKKPCRVFVNSMSDLFHEEVKAEWVDAIFAVMGLTRQHTYQILTKRPARMRDEMKRLAKSMAPLEAKAREMGFTFKFDGLDGKEHSLLPWPIPNVWLGVSIENQDTADERIPLLMETPAAVRWLSIEPLIGPVSLRWLAAFPENAPYRAQKPAPANSTNELDGLRRLDWVVIGGESGTKEKSRRFDLRWAYDLIAQCRAAKVPVFMKQLGRNPYFSGGTEQAAATDLKLQDSHGGMMSEWPEDLRVREYPA